MIWPRNPHPNAPTPEQKLEPTRFKMPRGIGLDPRGTLFICPTEPPRPCGLYVIQGVAPGLGNIPSYPARDVQIRIWLKPFDPKTPAQMARRLLFAILVSNWRSFDDDHKKIWWAIGSARGISGLNAYMSAGLRYGGPP